MKSIISTINEYKAKSVVPITDQQIAYIPTIDENQIEYTIPFYILEGKRVPLNIMDQLFIKVKYFKFGRLYNRNLTKFRVGLFSLKELVDGKILNPFMLFINGYFVPWKHISILLNHDTYHIIINGNGDPFYSELCRKYDYIQIVNLPDIVNVVDNFKGNSYDALFTFNSKGKFDINNISYAVVNTTKSDTVGFNYWRTNDPVDGFILLNQNDIKISKDNIILFVNGLFSTGKRIKVKKAMEKEEIVEGSNDRSHLEFAYSENDIGSNPEIKIDSTLLSINNGRNDEYDIYDFGLFVSSEYTETADNISKVDLKSLSNVVRETNSGNLDHKYINDLRTPFIMKMDKNKNYDDNVSDCIKTIIKYNSSFFNNTIKSNSNVEITEYTGKWLLSNMKYNNTIHIPVDHRGKNDELFILLVNGEFYEYYNSSYKIVNKLIIPIRDIRDTDTVEFIRFKNIDNRNMNIVINQNDEYLPYDADIINYNMSLFSSVYNGASYEYPENGKQNFEIGYNLQTNADGKIKIILDDPFYYGKILTVASKNRAMYYGFSIPASSQYSKIDIDLGDTFKYCTDYNKFIVFINGKRITSDHYRLVLPTKPTTPFYEYRIYLSTPVKPGDRFDIIYTPNLIQDIVINPTVNTSGDIILDKSILDYGFSTDLFMIWINGKKIPASHMRDIDSKHIRIITDEKSTNELCIMRYIPSINVLDQIFDVNNSIWDTIISKMSNDEINKMLGLQNNNITDIETHLYDNSASIKSIMHELIRDQFVSNPNVDVSKTFIYDYKDIDSSVTDDGVDSAGNPVIMSMDANTNESIDVNREYK